MRCPSGYRPDRPFHLARGYRLGTASFGKLYPMSLLLRAVIRTDLGLRRETNEDDAYASPRLVAVADGVGGLPAGELASRAAISTLSTLDAAPAAEGDPAEEGSAKGDPAEEGPAEEGPAEEGPVKEGPAQEGPARQVD